MIPIIMAALSMAQAKAQAQNQQNQALADQMRQPMLQNQQAQMPTIQSIFGQR